MLLWFVESGKEEVSGEAEVTGMSVQATGQGSSVLGGFICCF